MSGADRAFAQSTYPERPIKLLIPLAPGGIADTVGRVVVG